MAKVIRNVKKHNLLKTKKVIKKQLMEMFDIPTSVTTRQKQLQNYREFVQHLFSNSDENCELADES